MCMYVLKKKKSWITWGNPSIALKMTKDERLVLFSSVFFEVF